MVASRGSLRFLLAASLVLPCLPVSAQAPVVKPAVEPPQPPAAPATPPMAKVVELCNTSLPHGADPQAKVTTVGECLAVQSVSPEFHALAGQLIRAVAGEQVPDTD